MLYCFMCLQVCRSKANNQSPGGSETFRVLICKAKQLKEQALWVFNSFGSSILEVSSNLSKVYKSEEYLLLVANLLPEEVDLHYFCYLVII